MHHYSICLWPPPLGGWQRSEALFYPINLFLHCPSSEEHNFNDDKKVFTVEYPSLHCEYVLLLLINKAADWPIARQDRDRQDKQTKDTGMKRGTVRE